MIGSTRTELAQGILSIMRENDLSLDEAVEKISSKIQQDEQVQEQLINNELPFVLHSMFENYVEESRRSGKISNEQGLPVQVDQGRYVFPNQLTRDDLQSLSESVLHQLADEQEVQSAFQTAAERCGPSDTLEDIFGELPQEDREVITSVTGWGGKVSA